MSINIFLRKKNRHDFVLPPNKAVDRTAKTTNVSERTVAWICSKRGESSSERTEFSSPPPSLATVTNIDDFDKSVIRRTVLSSYSMNEIPTLMKMKEEVKEKISFNGSKKNNFF